MKDLIVYVIMVVFMLFLIIINTINKNIVGLFACIIALIYWLKLTINQIFDIKKNKK